MSNAVNARIQGDEYQACFFWLQSCKLFFEHTGVEKVSYEADNIKSFDDVVVSYKKEKPIIDCRNNPIFADFFQVKFHMTKDGAFTWDGLMNPDFINATSFSILNRLHEARKQYSPDGKKSRFYLVAPWIICPEDELSKLVSNNEGELRLDKLFDQKIKSNMAKIREALRRHVGLSSDKELLELLMPFRIWSNSWNNQILLEILNRDLIYAGFKPIENSSLINPYSSLVKKWSLNGLKEFTKEFIIEECTREGLYVGTAKKSESITIGIRSFYRRAENMADETISMVCFLEHFDGRNIKNNSSWDDDILPKLNIYLSENVIPGNKYELYLDTHLSIAFAAGYLLDTKAGVEVYPTQKTISGRTLWYPIDDRTKKYNDWIFEEIILNKEYCDVAIALSITHNIKDDVINYVSENNINIKRLINCRIENKQHNNAISDGAHAKKLANEISSLQKKRSIDEKRANLHIFGASPVSFMFFLGQVSRGFGKTIIYEYDFENCNGGSYTPALHFQ